MTQPQTTLPVEKHLRTQEGAPDDAPEFVNNQTVSVSVYDEHKRMVEVMPLFLKGRPNGVPDDAVFKVKGHHYAQFRHPYGGLVPFRAGAPVATSPPQRVPQAPVQRQGQVTPLPPDHWAQNRPDDSAVQPPPAPPVDPAIDPEALADDSLAPDSALIATLVAATPAANEQERTEVISVILKRNRGIDARLPDELSSYQNVVDQYAPVVSPVDPVNQPTPLGATGPDEAPEPADNATVPQQVVAGPLAPAVAPAKPPAAKPRPRPNK